MDDLEAQVGMTASRITEIEAAARRKAKMVLWLGSSVAVSQFIFIFVGTFHVSSWDIMEPICYLMTFGNFTFGYFFYLW